MLAKVFGVYSGPTLMLAPRRVPPARWLAHEEAIARLRAESVRLQNRLDAMDVDKLDGKIDEAFFERKAAEWRAEQGRLLRSIEARQAANQSYLEEGV
jgi:site-specific DNA recombinase